MLLLKNLTLQKPLDAEFKASFAGKSLAAEGRLGPLGQNPGHGILPLDMAVNFFNAFSGQLKGNVSNILENPSFDLHLRVPPFSARELLTSLDLDSLVAATDQDNFRSVSFDIAAKGNNEMVSD